MVVLIFYSMYITISQYNTYLSNLMSFRLKVIGHVFVYVLAMSVCFSFWIFLSNSTFYSVMWGSVWDFFFAFGSFRSLQITLLVPLLSFHFFAIVCIKISIHQERKTWAKFTVRSIKSKSTKKSKRKTVILPLDLAHVTWINRCLFELFPAHTTPNIVTHKYIVRGRIVPKSRVFFRSKRYPSHRIAIHTCTQTHNNLYSRNSRSQFSISLSLFSPVFVYRKFQDSFRSVCGTKFYAIFLHTTQCSASRSFTRSLCVCVLIVSLCYHFVTYFLVGSFSFFVCVWVYVCVVIISRFIDLSKSHCHYYVLWSWRTTTMPFQSCGHT